MNWFLCVLRCNKSKTLELICSWMCYLCCWSFFPYPQPLFSKPIQSGSRPPGGSCQRSCEIVKGRAEHLTWQQLLFALCWRTIPPSLLTTCEDATITYWLWAGVVSPDAIYSGLAERKKKENRREKKLPRQLKLIGSLLVLGFGAFLCWFWQHPHSSFRLHFFTVALRVMRLKHEPWKSIRSSSLRTLTSCFFVPSPLLRLIEWKVCLPPSALPKPLLCLLACDEQQVISSVTAMSRWKQSSRSTKKDMSATCCRQAQKAIQPEATWNGIFTVLRFNEAELNLPSGFCSSHHRVSDTFFSH